MDGTIDHLWDASRTANAVSAGSTPSLPAQLLYTRREWAECAARRHHARRRNFEIDALLSALCDVMMGNFPTPSQVLFPPSVLFSYPTTATLKNKKLLLTETDK